MLEERKNAFAFLPSSSSPPAAAPSADLCSSEVERCANAAFFFFFFSSTPSLVVSVPRNPPAKPEERLNDSGSTFGRCWEYVGLRSLSEPLDSCRESPAAPGPPEDMRPFQTEEGNSTHSIPHIFWGRKNLLKKKERKFNRS